MRDLKCDFVFDFIDEFDFVSELPPVVRQHIEKCADCKKYLEMTEFLKQSIKNVDKVDVVEELFNRITYKSRVKLGKWFVFGGVVTALIIGVILIFNPVRKNNIVQDFYSSSSTSITETTDSLEYFYTIALEM